MHVSVESTDTLVRKMTVQVPAERVDEEVDKRLRSMTKTVRLHGFRPGKVPLTVVKQRFGEQVKREVMGELLQRSYLEALNQENLRPAGAPTIETGAESERSGFEYTATFEVYPEFELAAVEEISIERPVVEITDGDVDKVIEGLRQQRRTWNAVSRPAQPGDQLVVDFAGAIDGEPFDGSKAEDFAVELGVGRMIPGFEDQLVGVEQGQEKTIQVTFPEDYRAANFAGKVAEFQVKVKSVSEPLLPPIDEALADAFGVKEGGVETFRNEVRTNMERELNDKIKSRIKSQVMQGLLEQNPVEVPTPLVKEEIERMRKSMMEMSGSTDASRFPDEQFEQEARRRVSLGLIINEIINKQGFQTDEGKIQTVLEGIASSYDDPQQVISYYRSNRQAMVEIEAVVMEDQVVDWVLDRAQVHDKPAGFSELVNIGTAEDTNS